MDIIRPSEGRVTGSIPVEGATNNALKVIDEGSKRYYDAFRQPIPGSDLG